MGHVDDRVTDFVYLVENEIAEKLDNIPITSFGPTRFSSKPIHITLVRNADFVDSEVDLLWSFIDEAEFTQKPNKTSIF